MTDHPTPPPPPPPESPPPSPASPPPPEPAGGSSNVLMLVLSYLGPLALIPLLVEKEDRDVQWHAKHGLVLFVAEIALWIALVIVFRLIGAVIGGCLTGFVSVVVGLTLSIAIMALHVLCIVKAVNGGRLVVPGLTEYVDRL